jgi:ribosomal-protein-alanine N-acetyltransferase
MNPRSHALVRRMTLADLDPVIEIAASLPSLPQWPRSAWLAALDSQSTPLRIALVAEDPIDSVTAGFAVASLLGAQAELESIAVAAQFQRRSMAMRLFVALAAELCAAQVTEMILEVRASNQPALAFYRRLGFLETGRRARYYESPVEDAVLMRLQL